MAGLRYTVNCSMLLTDLPLLRRPQEAKRYGFDAIELWWPYDDPAPPSSDLENLIAAIQDAEVALTGLNLYGGRAGERGVLSSPERQSEFEDNLAVVAEVGERLGCRRFNALFGKRSDAMALHEQIDVAVANLVYAAHTLAPFGGVVMVEPISGIPDYPLKKAADAVQVIEDVRAAGPSNVGLLADLYHLSVNGDDVDRVITDQFQEIAHVQIADDPGRGAPGTGELPLRAWLTLLESGGYEGFIGLEYVSDGDPFGWLTHRLRTQTADN